MVNVSCLCKKVIARQLQLLHQLVELGIVVLECLRLAEVELDLTLGFSGGLYSWEGPLEPLCKQRESGLLFRRKSSSIQSVVMEQGCSTVGEVSPPPFPP